MLLQSITFKSEMKQSAVYLEHGSGKGRSLWTLSTSLRKRLIRIDQAPKGDVLTAGSSRLDNEVM